MSISRLNLIQSSLQNIPASAIAFSEISMPGTLTVVAFHLPTTKAILWIALPPRAEHFYLRLYPGDMYHHLGGSIAQNRERQLSFDQDCLQSSAPDALRALSPMPDNESYAYDAALNAELPSPTQIMTYLTSDDSVVFNRMAMLFGNFVSQAGPWLSDLPQRQFKSPYFLGDSDDISVRAFKARALNGLSALRMGKLGKVGQINALTSYIKKLIPPTAMAWFHPGYFCNPSLDLSVGILNYVDSAHALAIQELYEARAALLRLTPLPLFTEPALEILRFNSSEELQTGAHRIFSDRLAIDIEAYSQKWVERCPILDKANVDINYPM